MDGCRTFDGYNATIFAYGQVVVIYIVFHCVIICVCVCVYFLMLLMQH